MRLIRTGLIAALLVVVLGTAGCVAIIPIPVPVPFPAGGDLFGLTDVSGPYADDQYEAGPPLEDVASLPVDASGVGIIEGTPSGDADSSEDDGSFELILDPAPSGIEPRTTVEVEINHSTKVLREGKYQGDPVDALNSEDEDADPSYADRVRVRFRIKDGEVFAESIDLIDEY